MTALKTLQDRGQSIWLDSISRELLESGTLAGYIANLSVTGLTSNPTLVEHAIAASDRYDGDIRRSPRARVLGRAPLLRLRPRGHRRRRGSLPPRDIPGGIYTSSLPAVTSPLGVPSRLMATSQPPTRIRSAPRIPGKVSPSVLCVASNRFEKSTASSSRSDAVSLASLPFFGRRTTGCQADCSELRVRKPQPGRDTHSDGRPAA